mmetsp:Transcript_16107/g.11622  ORF Transcript_16107/g.11622 Transcript_16107/m.11622 type:complete len:106 (+) Transcript_16107:90-407(+)
MRRITANEFSESYEVTIGVEFGSLMAKIEDVSFKLQIWDTAGQERYSAVTRSFYKNAHLVIFTYSISSRQSFHSLNMWYKEVQNASDNDAIFMLVGNKCDMELER